MRHPCFPPPTGPLEIRASGVGQSCRSGGALCCPHGLGLAHKEDGASSALLPPWQELQSHFTAAGGTLAFPTARHSPFPLSEKMKPFPALSFGQ